jgi:hypothetical protein
VGEGQRIARPYPLPRRRRRCTEGLIGAIHKSADPRLELRLAVAQRRRGHAGDAGIADGEFGAVDFRTDRGAIEGHALAVDIGGERSVDDIGLAADIDDVVGRQAGVLVDVDSRTTPR